MRDVQATGDAPLTERPPGAARPAGRQPVVLVVAALVVLADLVTKTWVVHHFADGHVTTVVHGVLDLQQSRNPGAAFGLATGGTVVLALVAAAVAVVIVRVSRGLRSTPWAVSLGLLLGGAVGNLGDRVFRRPEFLRGQVVDWIHLHHWPVFNLADSAITVGVVLATLLALRGIRFDGTRESR